MLFGKAFGFLKYSNTILVLRLWPKKKILVLCKKIEIAITTRLSCVLHKVHILACIIFFFYSPPSFSQLHRVPQSSSSSLVTPSTSNLSTTYPNKNKSVNKMLFFYTIRIQRNFLVRIRDGRVSGIHPMGHQCVNIRENMVPYSNLSCKEVYLSITRSGLINHLSVLIGRL